MIAVINRLPGKECEADQVVERFANGQGLVQEFEARRELPNLLVERMGIGCDKHGQRNVELACRYRPSGCANGVRDSDGSRWSNVQDSMIDAMIRLERGFRPYIRKLAI